MSFTTCRRCWETSGLDKQLPQGTLLGACMWCFVTLDPGAKQYWKDKQAFKWGMCPFLLTLLFFVSSQQAPPLLEMGRLNNFCFNSRDLSNTLVLTVHVCPCCISRIHFWFILGTETRDLYVLRCALLLSRVPSPLIHSYQHLIV